MGAGKNLNSHVKPSTHFIDLETEAQKTKRVIARGNRNQIFRVLVSRNPALGILTLLRSPAFLALSKLNKVAYIIWEG